MAIKRVRKKTEDNSQNVQMIRAFYSLNYSRESLIQKRKILIRKDSKNEFSVSKFFVGTELSRNDLSKEMRVTSGSRQWSGFFPTRLIAIAQKPAHCGCLFSLGVTKTNKGKCEF